MEIFQTFILVVAIFIENVSYFYDDDAAGADTVFVNNKIYF
jgi:hypothetical protein